MTEPLVLRQSRKTLALLTAAAVVMAIGGGAMATDADVVARYSRLSADQRVVIGWIAVALLGPCSLLGGLMLARPGTLALEPTGFRVRGLAPESFTAWSDVSAFFVQELGGQPFAAYSLKPEARSGRSRPAARPTASGDGFLPLYGHTPAALVGLLEDWRRRHEAAS